MTETSKKPYFAYRSFRKELKTRERFAELGVRQFCIFPANTVNALGQPYSEYPPVWLWEHQYDFAALDRQFEDILAFCPDAEFLFMLDLNSPPWLVRKLQCRQKASDSFAEVSGTLASGYWREVTAEYMKDILMHVQEKYGKHLACVILACGATDEWMDYSLGAETEDKLHLFRKWCAEQGLPVPLAIPDFERRYHSPRFGGLLRDPEKDRDAISYWRFHSDLIASGICNFAMEARKYLCDGQEIGVFYGYVLELTKNYLVGCGHLGYEKVLSSGAVDFLISPGDYHDRRMGGGGGFQNLNGCIHRNGRHFLHELDHHTHTCNLQVTPYARASWWTPWPDTASDIAGLRREFCRSLMHGASLWFFDMWGGYYSEPEIQNAIREMKILWDRLADYGREPEAEVAFVVDPQSVFYCNDHLENNPLLEIFHTLQKICNHLGAPYAMYDISDLPKLREVPKLTVLPMWIEFDERRRELLRSCLPGTRLLWLGPCGLTDGNRWGAQVLPEGTAFPDCSVFSAEILRREAELAGVHLYCDAALPVWASGSLLSCHCAEAERHTFRLKRRAAKVVELFSGRTVAENCGSFDYTFRKPETALFELIETK